jgi:anti-sigma B factor antagonist
MTITPRQPRRHRHARPPLIADVPAVRYYPAGDAEVAEAAVDLDARAAGPLQALLSDLATRQPCPRLFVDLNDVKFLDAAGLGALIRGWNHASKNGGYFAVACANAQVLRLLRLLELTAVLGVCDSVSHALRRVLDRPAAEATRSAT